jgi:hypothetical protein
MRLFAHDARIQLRDALLDPRAVGAGGVFELLRQIFTPAARRLQLA